MSVGSVTPVRYDLFKHGVISQVIANGQFVSPDMAGFGDGFFASSGALPAWMVYLLRDTRSTPTVISAPQGEQQAVIRSTNDGVILHAPFTAAPIVGDEVLLLHPNISTYPSSLAGIVNAIKAQTDKLAGSAPTASSTTANWQAAEQTIFVIGAAGIRYKVHSAIVDLNALIGNVTLRMYISVNGVQRQIFPPKATTFSPVAGDAPGVALINGTFGIANVLRFTAQSDNVADNGTSIPYEYFVEPM